MTWISPGGFASLAGAGAPRTAVGGCEEARAAHESTSAERAARGRARIDRVSDCTREARGPWRSAERFARTLRGEVTRGGADAAGQVFERRWRTRGRAFTLDAHAMTALTRHLFLMRAEARGLQTIDRRAGATHAARGLVEDAAYMKRPRVGGRAPSANDIDLVLPFGARGEDALGLVDGGIDLLDGHDDPLGSVRRIVGTVVCLEPRTRGDRVVMRDAWVDEGPVFRVVETLDFGVLPENGPPVAVCCAMAPLLIAPPRWAPFGEALSALEEESRAAVAPWISSRDEELAAVLELREGDRVEVVGVVCDPRTTARRFDVTHRSAPYRGASAAVALLVGDEPGVRLVVRRLGDVLEASVRPPRAPRAPSSALAPSGGVPVRHPRSATQLSRYGAAGATALSTTVLVLALALHGSISVVFLAAVVAVLCAGLWLSDRR